MPSRGRKRLHLGLRGSLAVEIVAPTTTTLRFGKEALRSCVAAVIALALAPTAGAQAPESERIRSLVERLRGDRRGPFQAIRWFCPDGSVLPPQERCAEPGGFQHGMLKPEVRALDERGIHLGPVLAGLDFGAFWDAEDRHARARQYLLVDYLRAADDGWIMRRARYYRGAVQAEDEETWSRAFLEWLLARDEALRSEFYLVRQLAGGLPRTGDAGLATRVRALAKDIAEAEPAFTDLRVKIHGHPDAGDATRVAAFRNARAARLTGGLVDQLHELEDGLRRLYGGGAEERLAAMAGSLGGGGAVADRLGAVLEGPPEGGPSREEWRVVQLAQLLWEARVAVETPGTPAARRIQLLDVSLAAETALMAGSAAWTPADLAALLRKNHALARAVAGVGLIERWEWAQLEPSMGPPPGARAIEVGELARCARRARRVVEWAAGMVRAVWGPEVERWSAFEPLVRGMIDDRTRSSALLLLGGSSAILADLAAHESGEVNHVLDLTFQSEVRGVNAGLARGRLEVIDPARTEEERFAPDRIYVLLQPPAEMKPVAGIASVSEGNLVSHVQLLARNLGIPNAVFSPRALQELAEHDGEEVFYAVSPRGAVLMKPAAEMTAAEQAAISNRVAADERFTAPVDRLDLSQRSVLDMRELTADDSGRLCGPKAANLGVLSHLFPDAVPPGLVIPFGVFAAHLEQQRPDADGTYWDAVHAVFAANAAADETVLAEGLRDLRRAIAEIPFRDGFRAEIEARFREWLGFELGERAVFIRSDTNMEDLEGFTGAGLNLTVPNVRGADEVMQAIRDVWASPFSERSYLWRSRALTNPAAVYPSIVILPSVAVDKSGVLITTGVATGDPGDGTIAFNWGGTGAVGGQAAETWLLEGSGDDVLLFPAREPEFTRLLPGGGLQSVAVSFDSPILGAGERAQIRAVESLIRGRLPGTRGLTTGPYDVELGFRDGHLWLFQVRRFVERGVGRATTYLMSLDAQAGVDRPPVPLDAPVGAAE